MPPASKSIAMDMRNLDAHSGPFPRYTTKNYVMLIQVYGFNAELYHNISEAQHKSQGLVAISLMVQLSYRESDRKVSDDNSMEKFRASPQT
ncbi:carbonic anhydrase-related protein 10 isoform X1, partial [Vespula squamosa]